VDKRKALGKGLAALIPEKKKGNFLVLGVEQIIPNPLQPRKDFSTTELEGLSSSIGEKGVIEPLIVRKKEGVFQLVCGERRWRAAQKAGLKDVPVIVRDANDQECLELQMIENLQRAGLNPLEEAEGYRTLIDAFFLTQEEVAAKVSRDRATVTNKLRLLKLPDKVKDALRIGSITEGHARALLSLDSVQRVISALELIRQKGLSVRETELLVRKLRTDGRPHEKKQDPHLRNFVEELQRATQRKVIIHMQKKGSGWLRIYFNSLDDLEDITGRLKK